MWPFPILLRERHIPGAIVCLLVDLDLTSWMTFKILSRTKSRTRGTLPGRVRLADPPDR